MMMSSKLEIDYVEYVTVFSCQQRVHFVAPLSAID